MSTTKIDRSQAPGARYLGAESIDAWERFQIDTKNHEMTVLRDDGLYRHLRIQSPGTWSYGHDIVTWPGYLAITGDMGTYVFCRVSDMFDFFANDEGSISPDYWAQKMPTAGARSSVQQFDEKAARQWVQEWIGRMIEDHEIQQVNDFRMDVSDNVLDAISDGGEPAFRLAVRDYEYANRVSFCSDDHWDMSWYRYSGQYLWACWAIVAAIGRYRALEKALSA